MRKILFTDKQIERLRKNKYVKNISYKAITYTDEFKNKVVFETENYKKFPKEVFEECGLEVNVIGEKRQKRDEQDKKDYELILKAYKYRNRKKGARQIKLLLQNKFGINFNLKK